MWRALSYTQNATSSQKGAGTAPLGDRPVVCGGPRLCGGDPGSRRGARLRKRKGWKQRAVSVSSV